MEGKGTRLKLRGGIWYIVFQGNSRGRSTGTGDRQAAERALATFIQQRDKDEAMTGAGLKVNQMLDDYMKEHGRLIASREQAEIACDYLKMHFGVDRVASTVGEDDIAAYVKARREGAITRNRKPKPAGDGTLRRELGTLTAAYNHAIRKKRLAVGSAPHVSPPPPPAPKDKWLTPDDEARLLAACPVEDPAKPARPARPRTLTKSYRPEREAVPARLTRIYRFVMLAMHTAARREALEKLTWFQVDFDTNRINLNPRDRLQTNKRRAVVPMSIPLRAVLERAYQEKTSGWVLDHSGSVRTIMEGLTAKARMEWVTPHVFRHTWATRAMRNRVPPIDVANMLGDDLKTVLKNYYHHHPDFLKDAADWRDREAATAADRKKEKA